MQKEYTILSYINYIIYILKIKITDQLRNKTDTYIYNKTQVYK